MCASPVSSGFSSVPCNRPFETSLPVMPGATMASDCRFASQRRSITSPYTPFTSTFDVPLLMRTSFNSKAPPRCEISPRPVSARSNNVPDIDAMRAVHGAASLKPLPAIEPATETRPCTSGRTCDTSRPLPAILNCHAWSPDHVSWPEPCSVPFMHGAVDTVEQQLAGVE